MAILNDLGRIRGPLAGFAAIGVCWGVFAGSVPVIMAQTGLGDGGFATAMLISTCGAIGAMWLAPWLEARLQHWAMPVFVAFIGTCFAMPGLATSGVQFAAIMLCCAAGAGMVDVAMNAQLSHLEARTGRPLMNLAHGAYSLVYACAALSAGIARGMGAPTWGIFLVAGALTVTLALLARGGGPELHGGEDESAAAQEPRGAFLWAIVALAGVVICIGFLAEQATEAWSALHLERNLGAGAVGGALAPTLLGLTMGLGRFAGQGVIGRINGAGVLGAGAVVAALGALVAALAQTAWMGWAGFAVLGFGVSVLAPMAYAWLGGRVTPRARAWAVSRATVIGYAGFFLGPPLMGGLSEAFGLRVSFGAVALLLLAVPLVLLPLMARR